MLQNLKVRIRDLLCVRLFSSKRKWENCHVMVYTFEVRVETWLLQKWSHAQTHGQHRLRTHL